MAVPVTLTPKKNFITPNKKGSLGMQSLKHSPFTSTSSSSVQVQFTTPKTKKITSAKTPECFNTVTVEPLTNSSLKRTSEDTFGQESNLTVAVRIRPINTKELTHAEISDVIRVREQELIITSNSTGNTSLNVAHMFQYDYIFWSCDETSPLYSSQEDVFMTIGKPLLNSAFRGYNACLFAYGQTGTGKSFSMMGKNSCDAIDIDSDNYSGITPRFCRDVFDSISKLDENSTATVEISYFEIYNEKIHDLLSSQCTTTKTPLKVREHPEWGPYVVDLNIHTVQTYKELRNWLILGNKNRATAATVMNDKSSRSHSIFSIEICLTTKSSNAENSRRSKVNLVDLAGSERLVTCHNSEEKIRQGVSINKSLLTLGKVISALADQKKNQFVPYRDSVLTWLLRESLGGNSLTCMLATITPASTYLDETLATLRYACQARSIINRARINETPHDRLIRELRSEVQRLKVLKENYERNFVANICVNPDRQNEKEELGHLRQKLDQAENKLIDAKEVWSKRFKECAQSQLKELAESEKRREELESKIRILKTSNTNLDISLYKTNFLEELEHVLTNEHEVLNESVINIVHWCHKNNFSYAVTESAMNIVDNVNEREGFLLLKDLNEKNCDFTNSITWHDIIKPMKKLNKTEIMSSLNKIYKELNNLKPPETDNNLNLMFAKVNKSLQSFEAALLNNISKNNEQKSVTFNL